MQNYPACKDRFHTFPMKIITIESVAGCRNTILSYQEVRFSLDIAQVWVFSEVEPSLLNVSDNSERTEMNYC